MELTPTPLNVLAQRLFVERVRDIEESDLVRAEAQRAIRDAKIFAQELNGEEDE